ncbi:alkaline phosphatase family protein [Candidatus Woesearchaeota archaeon]|nr:alkaline phosphatase family protein [Candidatus Woesearchaeota archaeon]
MEENKIIVIGLDGAGFELIQPWIDEGALPNIKKIQEEGCWTDMDVYLPPVTCPNWKCYSTSKNPGNLGAFWWENIDLNTKKFYHPRKNYIKHKEIWDYLSEKGKKVIIMNMPTTYPAKKVNGILIAGGPDADDAHFVYPRSLKDQLKQENYQIHAEKLNPLIFAKEEIFESCRSTIEKRFSVFKKLLKNHEWDLAQITIFHINALQHFFWDDDVTKRMWQILDTHIGKLMKQHTLLLMSDHGSNKIDVAFNINTWLEKNKYLVLKKQTKSIFQKIGLTQEAGYRAANKLGLSKDMLLKILPKKILNLIPYSGGEFKGESKNEKIEWEKSKAIACSQGPVYLLNTLKETADYEKLRKKLKEDFESLKDPATGKRIIKKAYFKEEIYCGEYITEAPDMILDMEKGVHILGHIGKEAVFEKPNKWKGENKKQGLFMMYGKSIPCKGRIENVHILDLAPTILSKLGIEIPASFEGKIITAVQKGIEK